jgi:thiol-disulfide isomerase/thioredoxin
MTATIPALPSRRAEADAVPVVAVTLGNMSRDRSSSTYPRSMSPVLALALIGVLVTVATLVAVASRSRDGRARRGRTGSFDPKDAAHSALGTRATLVQFSTETCARCPQVRRVLQGYVDVEAGVAHVEVDLTRRPDLSSRYRILQTPTTFLVDGEGGVRARFLGVPQRQALTDALATLGATIRSTS